MPSHTQKKEFITAQKISGVSEAEAKEALLGLQGLSEDSEVSNAIKGEATLLYRQLTANLGSSRAREELLAKATALANRA